MTKYPPLQWDEQTELLSRSGACASGHSGLQGICAVCGAWLPSAVCRDATCGWSAEAGESTLRDAVDHRLETGHQVRVVVGGYVEDE